MELLAATVALESLKEHCDVRLYSDSRYIVDAVATGSVFRWRAKNWKNGKVQSIDLWERFLAAYLNHTVEVVWVKGHAGIEGNERCDQLASEAIAGADLEIDQGYLASDTSGCEKELQSFGRRTNGSVFGLGLPPNRHLFQLAREIYNRHVANFVHYIRISLTGIAMENR